MGKRTSISTGGAAVSPAAKSRCVSTGRFQVKAADAAAAAADVVPARTSVSTGGAAVSPAAKSRCVSTGRFVVKAADATAAAADVVPAQADHLLVVCDATAASADVVPAQVDHLLVACQPTMKALRSRRDVTFSASEMLCAALPFALRPTKGGQARHAYQEKILDTVEEQLVMALATQREAIAAIEKQSDDLEAEYLQSRNIPEGIELRVEEKKKTMDNAADVLKKQQAALHKAQLALQAEKILSTAAAAEKQRKEQDRDDFVAAHAELWVPLEASECPGSLWRKRDADLNKLVQKFEDIGAEQSLVAGMQAAMKIRKDARSEFAQYTLTSAEEIYNKHIEVLKKRVCNVEEDISERPAAVAAAEVAFSAASSSNDAAMDASNVAKNAWVEESTILSNHKAKMEAYERMKLRLAECIVEARAKLAQSTQAYDGFKAMRPVNAVLDLAAGIEEEKKSAEEMVLEEPAP